MWSMTGWINSGLFRILGAFSERMYWTYLRFASALSARHSTYEIQYEYCWYFPGPCSSLPCSQGQILQVKGQYSLIPPFTEQISIAHSVLASLSIRALHMKGAQNWGHSGLGFQAHCSFHRSQLEQAACNAPGSQDSCALPTDDSPWPSVWDHYLGLLIREVEIMLQAGKGVLTPDTYASNFRLRYEVRQKGSFIRWSPVHVQFRCPGSSDGEVFFSHCQHKKTKLLSLALNSPNKEAVNTSLLFRFLKKDTVYFISLLQSFKFWDAMQKESAASTQQGSAANPREKPSLENTPLPSKRCLWELGISKAKHRGILEREGEASTEGNTW